MKNITLDELMSRMHYKEWVELTRYGAIAGHKDLRYNILGNYFSVRWWGVDGTSGADWFTNASGAVLEYNSVKL
jgi:hypothetical protein